MILERKIGFRRFDRAFTLIEMVTVIAILVILMTSGISLLNGTGSQSRKAGTDMISGLIEQARTIAITSRSEVLMAIAEPGDLVGTDERCRIGLFRLRAPVTGAAPGAPDRYDLLTRWQTLNTGVVLIGRQQNDPPIANQLKNPLDEPQVNIVYGPSGKEITVNAHVISINSRGSLKLPTGSGPIAFRIAEGAYRKKVATANIRSGANGPTENLLRVGRVTARPYRID